MFFSIARPWLKNRLPSFGARDSFFHDHKVLANLVIGRENSEVARRLTC